MFAFAFLSPARGAHANQNRHASMARLRSLPNECPRPDPDALPSLSVNRHSVQGEGTWQDPLRAVHPSLPSAQSPWGDGLRQRCVFRRCSVGIEPLAHAGSCYSRGLGGPG